MLIPVLMSHHANQRPDKTACLYSFHLRII